MSQIRCMNSVLIDREGNYSNADCRTVRKLTELMV